MDEKLIKLYSPIDKAKADSVLDALFVISLSTIRYH